ncbi:nucleotidyltransferase AbiEii toxin of type IV toxin-antitoxin system [Kribbella voronezhensis]|uniref:Nucleotidyltransferase AbiEii toxin of type IV toxin-antitoxin system n=1 Tax=Kribbella voronezhensis TaxID=2512212 RepID=A0A4R7TAA2_9ACTN|nr:nucleotidyl transferase AbiEii/AbiGii toxin family protein [Kribbella voronezhensis]TDU88921.1 nucleotidyltransferase AbiEii toxin of type IV toxin-antitoxin system [Kribbella voronezhensis]
MTPTNRSTPAGRAYLDLQNRARRDRRGTQELLTLYVVERWLARLSRSKHVDDFVLKGGMLLAAFGRRRPTVDLDALARNFRSDQEVVAARVAEIAAADDPEDGVEFLTDSLTTRLIRDGALYAGVRVTMDARIATAAVKLRLDVNFGDPVTPGPRLVELPALRPGVEPIKILGYPMETVLAEKLATAIALGPANTRVRDFADLYVLTGLRAFTQSCVRAALMATVLFRGTPMVPLSEVVTGIVALRSPAYAAYRRNLGQEGDHLPQHFEELMHAVVTFGDGLLREAPAETRWDPVERRWVG